MDKQTALAILRHIHKDMYGQWIIPYYPRYCEKEVTLLNGKKATCVMEDAVYAFLDYVENLIENAED